MSVPCTSLSILSAFEFSSQRSPWVGIKPRPPGPKFTVALVLVASCKRDNAALCSSAEIEARCDSRGTTRRTFQQKRGHETSGPEKILGGEIKNTMRPLSNSETVSKRTGSKKADANTFDDKITTVTPRIERLILMLFNVGAQPTPFAVGWSNLLTRTTPSGGAPRESGIRNQS